MLNLQGNKNLIVKDPSGLLLPPNGDAANWLYNYYETGAYNTETEKVMASSSISPPPPPYLTPENGEDTINAQAKVEKEHARSMLARTSGYLLESEKELIRKLKDYAVAVAPPPTSLDSSTSSWWRSLVYKTSAAAGTTTSDVQTENLLDNVPEIVLKKLKLESLKESAAAVAAMAAANTTTGSDTEIDSEISFSCGDDEDLDTYEVEEYSSQAETTTQQDSILNDDNNRLSNKKTNKRKRRNVLIAPVGDDWSASVWMDHPNAATFDIIALYFGDNATYACPLCAEVVHAKGPKWRLFFDFTSSSSWASVSTKYEYIMLPDDDLHMNTCAINKVFSTMRTYDLLMAQPSVCHVRGSATWRPELHQNPQYLLRYTTFVEVMAPTYRMDLFHNVIRATFSKYWTYVGWGLDSVWPALLHYPKDRIAVIDAVCMRHVPTQGGLGNGSGKKSSVYAPGLSPYTAKQEELIVFSAFNYSATTTQALGERFMNMRVLGSVPNFYVLEAMAKTAGQKWPSVEFAGEYGVQEEAMEPLMRREREVQKALAELEQQLYSIEITKAANSNLKNNQYIIKKNIDTPYGNRLLTNNEFREAGGDHVVRARAWVWVVPIAALAMITAKVILLSNGSSGSGGGMLLLGPGRGWRRVRSYDSPLKR